MDERACSQNNSSGTSSPFYGDRLSGKTVQWINIARQRVSENHLRGTKSPDKATVCLEKLL